MWKQLVSSALELVGTWEDFVLQKFYKKYLKILQRGNDEEPLR